MAFKTIHTLYGLTRMAQAEATGVPINLSHMAVGDGNGNPIDPKETDTQLARERYRSTVNRVYQSPTDPKRFTAELVIPASEGGYVLREIGVFDSNGSLFAVGNLPDTYKTTAEEGVFSDVIVRMDFVVSNATVVTLMVDPGIAVASQAWVVSNMTAAKIIPGGTVGQLLGKSSNADGAYEWKDLGAINVTVDTIAEKQLLAAGQTVVDLSLTTTYGLAVYIDGKRIDMGAGAGEWQPHATIPTRLNLGQSYPANTRITLVNNEPAGSAPAPLERGQNLADVLDKAQARANLDIFSKDETRQMAPVAQYGFFDRTTAPAGWLKANGAVISRTAYAELFAQLGTRYGAGDGFTTFNLPDRRGDFPRGWDDGRGVDGGRELGSWQAGLIQSHAHAATAASAGGHAHTGTTNTTGSHVHDFVQDRSGNQNLLTPASTDNADEGFAEGSSVMRPAGAHSHVLNIDAASNHSHTITISASGGAETRPRNFATLICIKF